MDCELLTDDDEERKLLIHIAIFFDKSKVTFLVILHCRIPPRAGEEATLPWESITVT